jgi:hypothetical protein
LKRTFEIRFCHWLVSSTPGHDVLKQHTASLKT